MDGRSDPGLRVLGVLAGLGAALPIGYFALLALRWCPTCPVSVVLGGITLGLIIATIAIADGEAWGALVIACYGAGMAILYRLNVVYPTTADSMFVAINVAIAVLALVVAWGLARLDRGADPRGRPGVGRPG